MTQPQFDALMDLVNTKINNDARRARVWTLGRLRGMLKLLLSETPVFVDTGDDHPLGCPHELRSYRGYYERLAISLMHLAIEDPHPRTRLHAGHASSDYSEGAHRVDIEGPCTAGKLIEALELADGVEFEGYKGGQFLMGAHTFLHVAPYGSTGRYVSGMRVQPTLVSHILVIETAEEEF